MILNIFYFIILFIKEQNFYHDSFVGLVSYRHFLILLKVMILILKIIQLNFYFNNKLKIYFYFMYS